MAIYAAQGSAAGVVGRWDSRSRIAPTDDATPHRAHRSHLHTPLPLEFLRGQAEAMTDIGVPGHMLGAYPPDAGTSSTDQPNRSGPVHDGGQLRVQLLRQRPPMPRGRRDIRRLLVGHWAV